MILSPNQCDAVTELVNIAFARAAAALSVLSGDRVEVSVPDVSSHPIEKLEQALSGLVSGEVASVHQIFGGPMQGDALLLLNLEGAKQLVGLLMEGDAVIDQIGASAKEVLSEVGNILLNACLSVFGDLLQVRFSFSVPQLHLESLTSMLASLVVEKDQVRHAMVMGARFAIRTSNVTGCLILVLGITSLERFVAAVENWGEYVGG